jgi:hypothetical protein
VAFTASQLEEIAAWCASSRDLAAERKEAQRQFFGEDDEQPAAYWPGAGDSASRQRRFQGWFMFDVRLADGRQPAEVAAASLYRGTELAEARGAVCRTRFVVAIVGSTDGRRSMFLELEDEHFEVRSTTLAQLMARGRALVAHLVPVRQRFWLPGPGWLEWPVGLGPNMRRELKTFQPDPIQVERLLQGRAASAEDQPTPDQPEDATLDAAVARMTAAAQAAGRHGLELSIEEWRAMVLRHMSGTDPNAYFEEVIGRIGAAGSTEDLNRLLGLANNIWNTTPQPDRGGKTANELIEPWRTRRD